MINWKELEKFIAPGKVMTLVIMIDGKEVGALSFNVDTLAYKEILEVVKPAEPVIIAEKPKAEPAKTVTTAKKSTKAKPAPVKPVIEPEVEPKDDNDGDNVDTETGEIKETVVEAIKEPIEEVKVEEDVPLSREQIMAQTKPEVAKSMEIKDLGENAIMVTIKKEPVVPEEKKEQTLGGDEW
jgi:hypothetical protein